MRRIAALGVATCALFASAGTLATSSALAADPTVSTGTTTNITDTRATLNGTVNAQGQAVNYGFQYGTTTDYGQQTRLVLVDAETVDRAVSAEVQELTPGTDYHVRVFATNASGVVLLDSTSSISTRMTSRRAFRSADRLRCCRPRLHKSIPMRSPMRCCAMRPRADYAFTTERP